MLEIKLSNGEVSKIKCSSQDVLDEVEQQNKICIHTSRFLIDPIEIISFTYTFK